MALVFAACSGRTPGNWSELSGEWDVISINGVEVVVDTAVNKQPFVGFSQDGRLYGCTGCNNIMGSITAQDDPAMADFSKLATTMMMCQDMTLEQNFLMAIKDVTHYYTVDEGTIEFVNSDDTVRMVLRKR